MTRKCKGKLFKQKLNIRHTSPVKHSQQAAVKDAEILKPPCAGKTPPGSLPDLSSY